MVINLTYELSGLDETRWQALKQRKPQLTADFVYAVTTTGIYCRPGCRSRLPKRQNVRFYNRWQEAEAAGFRACKRCTPRLAQDEFPHRQALIAACETIRAADSPPRLAELAQQAGLSPYYFHRLFRQWVGVTPRQYYDQTRLERLQANLQQEESVTEAVFSSGYGSSSSFYAAAPTRLGMKPSLYRDGGRGVQIRYGLAQSSLGWVLVAATPTGICAIDLGDAPDKLQAQLRQRFPSAELIAGDPDFGSLVRQVVEYIEAPQLPLSLPLDIQGTAFQRRVWAALREIPFGERVSYGDLAKRIQQPGAARAVAQACGDNRLAVVVPCHRVVRKDGGLGGYRWGLERKRRLLERESSPQETASPSPA
jgi:AraC family transcriptional regulator of adaptative response/methylated-DNA-[protein]-cysteine methyltransferase